MKYKRLTLSAIVLFFFIPQTLFSQESNAAKNNKLKAQYFQAQAAFYEEDYDRALDVLIDMQKVKKLHELPRVQSLFVQVLIGQERHIEAKEQLDILYGLNNLSPSLLKEIAGYSANLDGLAANDQEKKDNASRSIDPIRDAMIDIKGGRFLMGSPNDEIGRNDRERLHEVTVSNFRLSKYEVTQDLWQSVMGNNPSYFKGCGRCPVEQVSWDDIQVFLSKINKVVDHNKYRLPTESEWEYAARSGTQTPFSTGNCISTDQANYHDNLDYEYSNCGKSGVLRDKTLEVGSFSPNSWGLYDMHGNVYEITCSAFNHVYDGSESRCSSSGGDNDEFSIRGGSYFRIAGSLRSAHRNGSTRDSRYKTDGFRLAQDSR